MGKGWREGAEMGRGGRGVRQSVSQSVSQAVSQAVSLSVSKSGGQSGRHQGNSRLVVVEPSLSTRGINVCK